MSKRLAHTCASLLSRASSVSQCAERSVRIREALSLPGCQLMTANALQ